MLGDLGVGPRSGGWDLGVVEVAAKTRRVVVYEYPLSPSHLKTSWPKCDIGPRKPH